MHALDARTGAERWRLDSNKFVTASPTVTTDSVYLGGVVGRVLAVEKATGAERWREQTRGALLTSPTVVSDSVYVGSANRTVSAFRE